VSSARSCVRERRAATNLFVVSIDSSFWQSGRFAIPASIRSWSAFVIRAVARDDLPAANRALFYIASRHVKLALDQAAIMAGLLIGCPIVVLVTVTNSANISPLDCVGWTLLGRDYVFRPSLDHRNATIEDAFRLGHFGNTNTHVGTTILDRVFGFRFA
jgi:hypothetical protein